MKKFLTASAVIALAIASQADAAANLVYAGVTGNTSSPQTVWNVGGTTPADANFYTLFLLQPVPAGSFLNSGVRNKTLNDPTALGENNFSIYGQSYYPGQQGNSDRSYTLTLRFDDGAEISGIYTPGVTTGGFTSTSSSTTSVGGTTYTLMDFQWNRGGGDVVGDYTTGADGQRPDYTGLFSFTAVPEPTTWAMMLVGFGMVGGAARYRRRSSAVVYS